MAEMRPERLRAMKASGFTLDANQEKVLAMAGAGTPAPAATVGKAGWSDAAAAAPSDDSLDVEVNMDSYQSGGGEGWVPPEKDGVYVGYCAGIIRSRTKDDEIMFDLRSVPNQQPVWRGALICTKLRTSGTGQGGSGAFKLRDAVVALGAIEEVNGNTVRISGYKDAPCKVEWATVQIGAGTQRRVQNIYPITAGVSAPV